MKGKSHRILITGGTGFLAQHLQRLCTSDSKIQTLVLSRSSTPSFEMEALSRDPELGGIGGAIKEFRPTALLHLAWGKMSREDRSHTFHIRENVIASQNLFNFVAREFPECRLVGLGSQAELGRMHCTITPVSVGKPENLYGEGKALVRDYVLSKFPQRSVWLRILTLYGPGDHSDKFIPYLVRCISSKVAAEISPGDQVWDFLHVEDAARALVAVVKAQEISGIHIVASGEAWPLKEVATRIFEEARMKGIEVPLRIGARPYSANELMQLKGDASSLQKATGWQPCIKLIEGLGSLVQSAL